MSAVTQPIPAIQPLSNIFVPADFDRASEAALDYAFDLARSHEAHVHVALYPHTKPPSSVDLPEWMSPEMAFEIGSDQTWTERLLRLERAGRLSAMPQTAYVNLVGNGEGLQAWLRKQRIDLTVAGVAHEAQAVKLAAMTSVPLLLLGPRLMANKLRPDFHRIVAATDFSPNAGAAVERAAIWARQERARLAVVHVVVDLATEREDPEELAAIRAAVRRQMALQAPSLHGDGVGNELEVSLQVEFGLPAPAILAFARRHEAGLIVLGAPQNRAAGEAGKRDWSEPENLSTLAELVREAECPVLAVPASKPKEQG